MQRSTLTILAFILPWVTANLLVSQGATAIASPIVPAKILPLEVELVRALNADTLQIGDDVLGKVRQDWTSGSCRLAAASVVHGKVTSLSAGANGRNTVALDFRLRCTHDDDPQKLIWIALLAPEPGQNDSLVLRQSFHSSSFGRGNSLRPDGNEPVGGNGKPGSAASGPPAGLDMSGRQNPSFPIFVETEEDRKAKRPDSVKTGEVFQLPRLKLDVGAGPEDSTVLSSKEKHIRLPMGSILVLLPESAAIRTAALTTPAPRVLTVKPAIIKSPSPIAPCAEPACTVLASVLATNTAPATPFRKLSLDRLGYNRLKAAEMRELEFSTAVAFLGDNHVLFTFDPHTLVRREHGDRPEDHPHVVRAVLLNITTGTVEHITEWRIRSNAQYLWPIDGERIIVHDGDHLRWLGANLREEQELKLDGPLAFLRMSPDRQHFAVGIVRELHTHDEHADLATADAAGPEEQVRVELLDAHLRIEEEGVSSSRAAPPILLDTGRIELRRAQPNSFYLREHAWTPGAEPRDFGHIESACVPDVQSMSSNLLIAEGCGHNPNERWLLVFRGDGAPVLKSSVRWREFSPRTADDRQGGMFAMAVCEGGGDYVRSSAFHGKDLNHETITVHRVSDGHQVFAMRMRSPLPSNQPVSFSASGKHMAVIDGDEIDIYSINPAQPLIAQSLHN